MGKMRIKGSVTPDCMATVTKAIETVDGVRQVNINMATGEITYGPTDCVDIGQIRDAVDKTGYEVEEK